MTQNNSELFRNILSVARNLTSTLDVDILLKKISALAEEKLDSEASAIMLMDEDGKNLSFKVAGGTKGGVVQRMKVPVGQGIAGWVAETRQPAIVNDVSNDPRFTGAQDKSSGFKTRKILCVPMMVESELIGIVEVLNKREGDYTDEDREILESLASMAAVSINNAKSAEEQRNFFVNILEVLVAAIEAQDVKLKGHNMRVTQIATAIGRHLGLSGKEYKDLYYGAMLHDIGILFSKNNRAAPDGIIISANSAGGADDTTHPIVGANMLAPINLLKGAVRIIRHHHENFDGTGYPDGLSGDNIPLGARIVYVAETVDEMRSAGMEPAAINRMLVAGKEIRFDPRIVDIYIHEISDRIGQE